MSLPSVESITIFKSRYTAPGVALGEGGYYFSLVCDEVPLVINLFDKENPDMKLKITISEEYKQGNAYTFGLGGELAGLCYTYSGNDLIDTCAKSFCYISDKTETETSSDMFGAAREALVSVLPGKIKPFRNPAPHINAKDLMIYKLHVRGFTKNMKKNPGTFLGLENKAEYIESLGMNSIMLMPAYEFHEISLAEEANHYHTMVTSMPNFWGYTEGYYFSPKRAYCTSDDVRGEFAHMVDTFHHRGIEVYMEFFMPYDINPTLALEVLRYWHTELGVDGFRVVGNDQILFAAKTDAYLSDCKLIGMNFGPSSYLDRSTTRTGDNEDRLIWYDEGFMEAGRRFLRGDEGGLEDFLEKSRRHQNGYNTINFIADQDGFSLMDTVSYERKHNETNGENNRDGKRYNITFNCGVEGPSKKSDINKLRERMIKNALSLVFLSASVPMIMAGDEFGMTHEGNNNPYCHDNNINYIDWNLLRKNKALVEYLKSLTTFRKSCGCIRPRYNFSLSDSLNKGMPDISYHSERAWYPTLEYYTHHVGILYCGAYAKEKKNVYILYNMHNEEHDFALISMAGKEYEVAVSTDNTGVSILEDQKKITLKPRMVAVLLS